MKVTPASIPDVLMIEPPLFGDSRGYFKEIFREEVLRLAGVEARFVQDNVSRSSKGVLRGMHYQITSPQAKLVGVITGSVLDVAVDVRRGSPTFGRHVACILSEENGRMMLIPEGFAHGFLVLSETCHFHYKCSNYYDPAAERGILWSDPALGIDWNVSKPIVSERDRQLKPLASVGQQDLPGYPS